MPGAPLLATPVDPFARIDRLDWPGPNRYRSASGQPGPDYWQQRADYTIAASLDTAAQYVSGTVTITYTNNSPDTLSFVWLQLDQNLYREGSLGSALHADATRWGARGFRGGYEIRNLTVNGRPALPSVDDTRDASEARRRRWRRTAARATIAMEYGFRVPDHGSDRMGRDGALFEIAQWYPRMAVYDDVRGWNTDPYYGQAEFYLEYGDIDYAVTVPAGYVVAGSGVLQNATEVLTAAQRARLAEAAHSESTIAIIAAGEAVGEAPRAGTRTWRFKAPNVRDVAWAAAPDFRWDATSWNGILMHAFYQFPKAGVAWERGAEYTRWSIKFYSQMVHPYPYPQATSVAGPVGGMEYPMFVMVHYGHSAADTASVFRTIDHEQGHEWFPMIVGSNERRYGWMDEGFNTYINAFSHEARGPDSTDLGGLSRGLEAGGGERHADAADDGAGPRAGGGATARSRTTSRRRCCSRCATTWSDAPRSTRRSASTRAAGPSSIRRRPTSSGPIENVTGRDLAWYWRAFFYSNDVLDIGIDTVYMVTTREGMSAVVRLSKRTSVPFPVELRLKLADGAVMDVTLPVEIWTGGDRYDATIPVNAAVTGARLWPDPSVPDWQPANDVWGDAPPANRRGPVTTGGLASPLVTNP